MANLKLIVVTSKIKKSGECVVLLQISAKHKVIRVSTGILVKPEHWLKGIIQGGLKNDRYAAVKNLKLAQLLNDCNQKIIQNAERIKQMDVYQLQSFLFNPEKEVTTDFLKFTQQRIAYFKAKGQDGTVGPLTATLNKVTAFWPKPTLDFNEMTVNWLELFESYCIQDKRKKNTIASYFRYIRSMFNDALEEDLEIKYPFKKFKFKGEPSRNRNLQVEVIRKIRDYKTEIRREEIARDIFMLQTYTLGINIKDLFYMPKDAMIEGRLQFDRAKTGRYYNIKIEPESQILFDKYSGKKYLLWFADHCDRERTTKRTAHSRETHYQYANEKALIRMLNNHLEEISNQLELSLQNKLTTYYSRHSFASLMRSVDISKDTISLALGHKDNEKSMKTTDGYINEDFIKVDIANRELIDFINSTFTDGESWKKFKEDQKEANKKPPKKTKG